MEVGIFYVKILTRVRMFGGVHRGAYPGMRFRALWTDDVCVIILADGKFMRLNPHEYELASSLV